MSLKLETQLQMRTWFRACPVLYAVPRGRSRSGKQVRVDFFRSAPRFDTSYIPPRFTGAPLEWANPILVDAGLIDLWCGGLPQGRGVRFDAPLEQSLAQFALKINAALFAGADGNPNIVRVEVL